MRSGSGLAFVLSLRNIRLIGASRSSMVTYLMPIFSIIVGVIVLHEHITWYQPVGALIVPSRRRGLQGLIRLGWHPQSRPLCPTDVPRQAAGVRCCGS